MNTGYPALLVSLLFCGSAEDVCALRFVRFGVVVTLVSYPPVSPGTGTVGRPGFDLAVCLLGVVESVVILYLVSKCQLLRVCICCYWCVCVWSTTSDLTVRKPTLVEQDC